MIESDIKVLPRQRQSGAQLVAANPAALGQQDTGAVKTAHGVPTTDAETVLGCERAAVVLPAPAAPV